jgi:hypothetical protein
MPKNLGQKGLAKVVKMCIKIIPEFVSKGGIWCQRGVKNDMQAGFFGKWPAFSSGLLMSREDRGPGSACEGDCLAGLALESAELRAVD